MEIYNKSRKYILNFIFERWKVNIKFVCNLKLSIESNIHNNTSNSIRFEIKN